jgi:hypothetical protein
VPFGDGIAVARDRDDAGSRFLVVNRTDGKITRVDLGEASGRTSSVLSGGTRGDFVAVDSHGCMYATQRDSVIRIAPARRRCDLVPSTPGAGTSVEPGILLETVGSRSASGGTARCRRVAKLLLRVRQKGRQRLRYVRVYVDGKHRVTLKNRRVTGRIVLRRLPTRRFTVKAVARTTRGKLLKKKMRVANC